MNKTESENNRMHIDFDPHQVDWAFFTALPDSLDVIGQAGGGGALMFGSGSYPVFTGMAYQRGAGLGSVLRSLWRSLLPLGRQAGAAIGRQGLESGARVLSGLLDGKELKETLASEGKAGLKNLLNKAADNLGKQQGSGGSFDFKRYKKTVGDDDGGIKRGVFSSMGPSIATSATPKPRNKRKSAPTVVKKRKKIRFDALGPY
jgi:hypothetical protein